MFRSLAILAVVGAGLALTACDNPAASILSTSRPGECYAVTGKDSLGQPKLIRTECAGATTPAPAAVAPVQAAATQCTAPIAPVAAPCAAATPTYSAPARTSVRRTARKAWRRWTGHQDNSVAVSGEVIPPSGYNYARPGETELAGGYSYRREETYVAAPPPAPLPPVYAERRVEAERQEIETRSFSSESSSGYASASSSSRRKKCNCSRDREHAVYEEYDRADGYLVWQGKARR